MSSIKTEELIQLVLKQIVSDAADAAVAEAVKNAEKMTKAAIAAWQIKAMSYTRMEINGSVVRLEFDLTDRLIAADSKDASHDLLLKALGLK